MIQTILFIILFKVLLISTQQIITIPQDIYAKQHTNVIFECKIAGYDPSQDLIEWCKNDFCTWGRLFEMSTQQRLQYKSLPKYFIIGNRTIGEWNLLIENVTDSEIGDYKCSLTRRSTKLKIESKSTKLNLMKKPQSVEFDSLKPIEIELDEIKTITCKVNDGIPRPTISWKVTDFKELNKDILLNNSINTYEQDVIISKIELKGTIDMRNKQLRCIVEHPLLDKPFVSSVDLNLKFAPVLTFNIDDVLIENKTQKFECIAIASPETIKPSIISLMDKHGQTVTQSMSGSIQLKITREMNGYTLNCFNENSIGNSVIKHLLNVSYPPQFKESLRSVININNPKEQVSLNCKVDSNPPAQIIWLKNDKDIVGYGETFELKNIQFDAYSRVFYQIGCVVNTKFDQIYSKTLIVTNGLPLMSGENVYYADNQKNFVAKFNILSSPDILTDPKCTKLSVNKKENLKQSFLPIENFGRYELLREQIDNQIVSNISRNYLFKINGVSNFDVGIFNCTVSNAIGSSSFIFELQMKNDNSKFVIALSTSILFLILLVCLIVLIIVFVLKLKLQRNKPKSHDKQPTSNGFNNTSYIKNSPNLSVSEWVTNTTEKYSDDKVSQCDITFDNKVNLNSMKSRSKSSFSSDNQIIMDKKNLTYDCLIMPLDPSNYMLGTDESKLYIDPTSSFNFNYYPINKQSANILSSKLQTNV